MIGLPPQLSELPVSLIFVYVWLRWSKLAVYRNLWYVKSPLWKVICLHLGLFVISAQAAKKNILTTQYEQKSNKQGVCYSGLTFIIILY
jgi:hypothetical protein